MSTSNTILLVAAIAGLAVGVYVLTRPKAPAAAQAPVVIHTGGPAASAGQRAAAPATGSGPDWGKIVTAGAGLIDTLASIDWGGDSEEGFTGW